MKFLRQNLQKLRKLTQSLKLTQKMTLEVQNWHWRSEFGPWRSDFRVLGQVCRFFFFVFWKMTPFYFSLVSEPGKLCFPQFYWFFDPGTHIFWIWGRKMKPQTWKNILVWFLSRITNIILRKISDKHFFLVDGFQFVGSFVLSIWDGTPTKM